MSAVGLAVLVPSSAGCSDDKNGLGYCVVTPESTELREGITNNASPGELVQADSGCVGDEILVCGGYNSRDQFVSDDCASGSGAPEGDG